MKVMMCIKTCGLVAANGTTITAKLESTISAKQQSLGYISALIHTSAMKEAFHFLQPSLSPFLRQNGELDFVARLSAGWMLHSGNCSSVNKSKADSDYVSVNEQSTERGRGKGGGEGKENFKSCLGGKARTLDGELTELMRQKGSRESQPGLCLLCSGHCQMSVSALVAMFL